MSEHTATTILMNERILPMPGPMVLLVSDEPDVQYAIAEIASGCGARLRITTSIGEAESLLATEPIRLIVCSDELAEEAIGVLIRPPGGPRVPVIVDARVWDKERYFNFLLAGATDYVLYENKKAIEQAVRNALRREVRDMRQPAAAN